MSDGLVETMEGRWVPGAGPVFTVAVGAGPIERYEGRHASRR
ncbi:hypothetical protein ACSDR0_26025 [Streptosporangium sp. G11]